MLDADKLFEEYSGKQSGDYEKFCANKNLMAITDDKIKYKGIIYRLSKIDIYSLTYLKIAHGYDAKYDGPERKPNDARELNGLFYTSVLNITETLDYEKMNKISRDEYHEIIKE